MSAKPSLLSQLHMGRKVCGQYAIDKLFGRAADRIAELEAENAMLQDRCGPSTVVLIGTVGHYVNDAVAAHIAELEAQIEAVYRCQRWEDAMVSQDTALTSTYRMVKSTTGRFMKAADIYAALDSGGG